MKKLLLTALIAFASISAHAEDKKIIDVVIKDHKFEPAEIKVKADEAFVLNVKNQDATPEEFESHDLKLEKVIAGNKEAKINVRPLKVGTYKFFGEFNEKTAQGVIVAE